MIEGVIIQRLSSDEVDESGIVGRCKVDISFYVKNLKNP